MADHAEDLRYLIHHVADSPVRMLGCSLGAVIGLHAGTQEPRLLEVLVAHEPVAPWLLPPSAAEEHRRELREIARTYRESGLDVTLPMIVESLGIDPATGRCESDLTPFPMDDRRLRNFDHFLRRDLEASAEDVMDPADLLDVPTRVIPAAGDLTPEGVFDRRCAEALSVLTSTPLEIFPGGHNGNLTHPNRYAARLRQVLAD
jgi:pimeloyl-ACP methyl ester carboxylesterase